MEEPSPLQTASLLSLGLFNWVNSVVAKASRVTHLSLDQLPPLPDTEATKNLVEEAFPVCFKLAVHEDLTLTSSLLPAH